MPIRSEQSINCDCGGRYTAKNRKKHMKTKKHRDYDYKKVCYYCEENTAADGMMTPMSQDGKNEKLCCDCFHKCGLLLRDEGWNFSFLADMVLDMKQEHIR